MTDGRVWAMLIIGGGLAPPPTVVFDHVAVVNCPGWAGWSMGGLSDGMFRCMTGGVDVVVVVVVD